MGQHELTDALAPHVRKPGDPSLNPTGKQGAPALRMKRREVRDALLHALHEPCTLPGYERMTWFEAGIRNLLTFYVLGEQWAVREVHNRAFGRVPLNVDLDVEQRSFQVVISLPDNGRDVRPPTVESDDDVLVLPAEPDGPAPEGNAPNDEVTD